MKPLYFAVLEKNVDPNSVELAKEIHSWVKPLVDEVSWGKSMGRMAPTVYLNSSQHHLFVIRPDGKVVIRFMNLQRKPPFNNRAVIQELLRRVNEIPGLEFPPDALNRKPNFNLEILSNPEAMEKFKTAIQWMIAQIQTKL